MGGLREDSNLSQSRALTACRRQAAVNWATICAVVLSKSKYVIRANVAMSGSGVFFSVNIDTGGYAE